MCMLKAATKELCLTHNIRHGQDKQNGTCEQSDHWQTGLQCSTVSVSANALAYGIKQNSKQEKALLYNKSFPNH